MPDLHKALADIDAIRTQVARGTEFRGYGPATVALTGLLALLASGIQALALDHPREQVGGYLAIWVGTAILSVALIGAETITRSRRLHSSLADEMIHAAIEQLLPAAVAGTLITFVLVRLAPESLWMLPGLWQIFYSLGIFASCRLLPRPTFWVAVFYLGTGLSVLALARGEAAFSPWAMGLPFGVGQALAAAVLYLTLERDHAST
jgi:hypothetical protein